MSLPNDGKPIPLLSEQMVGNMCFQIYPFLADPSSSNAAKEKVADSTQEDIWVVEMTETQIFKWNAGHEDTHTTVGAFSSKKTAIQNAKVALTNVDNCGDLFGPDGDLGPDGEEFWEDVQDNSATVGKDGGVVFSVGGERQEVSVSIKRVTLNKPIKKKTSDNSDSDNSDSDNSDSDGSDFCVGRRVLY